MSTKEILKLIENSDYPAVMALSEPFDHTYTNESGEQKLIVGAMLGNFSESKIIDMIERHQLTLQNDKDFILFEALRKNLQTLSNYIIDRTTDFSKVMEPQTDMIENPGDNPGITLLMQASCYLNCEARWQKILAATPKELLNYQSPIMYYDGDWGRDNAAHFAAMSDNPIDLYARLDLLYRAGVDFELENAHDSATALMNVITRDSVPEGIEQFLEGKPELLDGALDKFNTSLTYLKTNHPGHDQTLKYQDYVNFCVSLKEKITLLEVGRLSDVLPQGHQVRSYKL